MRWNENTFDIEKFKTSDYVVRCNTKEKALYFVKMLKMDYDFTFSNESPIDKNTGECTCYWNEFKENTCYSAFADSLAYGNLPYFKKDNRIIVDFYLSNEEEGVKNKITVNDLRNGMILTLRNGYKRYIIDNKVWMEDEDKLILNNRYLNHFKSLYDNNLTNSKTQYDIMEIKNVDGNIIWEREEDWSCIPIGTIVKVKNKENEVWRNKRFVCYKPNNSVKFVTLSDDLDEIEYWEKCQLI